MGIVERSAVTGSKLRTITPTVMEAPPGGGSRLPAYLQPRYVTADTRYVWTGNDQATSYSLGGGGLYGGSVSQINEATGKVVREIDSPADNFHFRFYDIVSDGTHVWIVNGSVSTPKGRRDDSVTELKDSNGPLVRVVLLRNGIYSDPVALVSNDVDVWVTDQGGGIEGIGSVFELNASTGTVVRVIAEQ
jgi:hypothetical protein